ncbi:uncharacterized protein LOC121413005 [Lytechinus variegatus]|uniref:uncharacterized protein LOC121413005 n=1 Tax=Lytechinus variegatus TaxID=7654 RepID=UPI001BB2032C|nr:uncharacterized protein LOC121413005 [Lytechinus variegatus]
MQSSGTSTTNETCTLGWESIGPGCYRLPPSLLNNYASAITICNSIGGHLFVPNSYDEITVAGSSYVRQWQKSGSEFNTWIGCKYEKEDESFVCTDGSRLNTDLWYDNVRVAEPEEKQICATQNVMNRLMVVTCEDDNLLTICEAGTFPRLKQHRVDFTPSIFAPDPDRKRRTLISYCREDHVIKLAPMGGKQRHALVCKYKCY